VKSDIVRRLAALNREFYQTLAIPFAATRGRIQPGAKQLLERVPFGAAVADLGCGNGNAAEFLGARGFSGRYAGYDLSPGLLDIAHSKEYPFPAEFRAADFLGKGWDRSIPGGSVDFILAFSVLHHLPGEAARLAFLGVCRRMLSSGGRFFFSTWQFPRSEKLRGRTVPWSVIGLCDSDVEEGDYLLDWRHDGSGLRYVHVVQARERLDLAKRSGFIEIESFASDGKEGRLADYAVWKPSPSSILPRQP
jgi:tRNA (uracil-5-)-methyltransferase TRM9